ARRAHVRSRLRGPRSAAVRVPSEHDVTTPTELTVVRHAEAWCNVEDIIGGPLGCRGLTPRGRDQARLLAERLAAGGGGYTAFYASPRRRAAETADILAPGLGLDVRYEPLFREQDFGVADGRPRAEL